MICLLAGATRHGLARVRDREPHRHASCASSACAGSARVLRTDPRVQRVDRRQPPGAHRDHVRPHVPARRAQRPRAAATRSRRPPSSPPSSRPTTANRNRDPAPGTRGWGVKNVLGGDLEPCGFDPLTGFYRDGCCSTGGDDPGVHVVCARMTAEFLAFSQAQGNDLSTPMPEHGFPGLQPGDRWCLCAVPLAGRVRGRRRPAGVPRGHPHPGARVVLGRRACASTRSTCPNTEPAPRH